MTRIDKTDYAAIIAEWHGRYHGELALWFKNSKGGAEAAAEKLFKDITEEQGAHEAKRIFQKVAASVKLNNRPRGSNKKEGTIPARELNALSDMTLKKGGTLRGLARALKEVARETDDFLFYNKLWGAIDRRIRRLGKKQRQDNHVAEELLKELDAASGL